MFNVIRWAYGFYQSRGWCIDVELIGGRNGYRVAVGGVDSMDGCRRNGIGHGGLTGHEIYALTINNGSVNHKEQITNIFLNSLVDYSPFPEYFRC